MGKADCSSKMLALLVVVMLGSSFSEGYILNKCELKSRLQIANLESEAIAKLVCTVEHTSLFNTSHVGMVKNFNPKHFNRPRPFFGYGASSVIGDYFPNWPPAERRITNSPLDGVTEEDFIAINPEQDPWFPVEGSGDQSEGGREEPSLDGSRKSLNDKPERKSKRHAEEKLGEQSEELSGDGSGQGSDVESPGMSFSGVGEPDYFDGSGEAPEPPTAQPQPINTVIYDDFEDLFSGHHENEQDSSRIHNPLESPEPPTYPPYFDETFDHGSGEGSGVQFDKTPEPINPQPLSEALIHDDSYEDLHPFDVDHGFGEESGDDFDTTPEPTTPPPTDMEIHYDSYEDLHPFDVDHGFGEGSGDHFDTTPEPTTPPPTDMEIHYDSYEDLHPFDADHGFGEGSGDHFDTTPEPTTPPPHTDIHGDSYEDLYPGGHPVNEREVSGIPFENPELTPEPTDPPPPTETQIYYDNFEDLYPGDASRFLYGIFQLIDMACKSESSDYLNICQLNCEDLLDDDITDDIECLRTLYPERMMFVEDCHSVVPSEYFAECD